MTIKPTLTRVRRKLLYIWGVRFPYLKVRIKALRALGYSVGKNVFIPSDLIITQNYATHDGDLIIGDNVSIGPAGVLTVVSHPNYSKIRNLIGHKDFKITIGDNVWIGANSVILSGINIGENSVIGAGSVVTKDVELNGIYAGVPAKKIKDLIIEE